MTILYETLGHSSNRFFSEQFYPVWKYLGQYFKIKFVPFGFAHSENNGRNFICKYGPSECASNRMQLCVLHLLENRPYKQIEFVLCQMDGRYEANGNSCINFVGLSFLSVSNCIGSYKAIELQQKAELITNKYDPSVMPTVIYNEKYNRLLHANSLLNFKWAICKLVPYIKFCSEVRRF